MMSQSSILAIIPWRKPLIDWLPFWAMRFKLKNVSDTAKVSWVSDDEV